MTEHSDKTRPLQLPMSPAPIFYEEDINIWLLQLDLYFARGGISTQREKFQVAASQIPAHILRDYADLLRSDDEHVYDQFVSALQTRSGRSTSIQLNQILATQQIGDRRPSQFLRHLQDIACNCGGVQDGDAEIIRQIFLNAIPKDILPILQSFPSSTPLAQLAEACDRITALTTSSTVSVNAVTKDDRIATLEKRVSELTKQVSALLRVPTHNSIRRRSSSRQRGRSVTPRPTNANNSLCWYHNKYGGAANKCTNPCSWSSEN